MITDLSANIWVLGGVMLLPIGLLTIYCIFKDHQSRSRERRHWSDD